MVIWYFNKSHIPTRPSQNPSNKDEPAAPGNSAKSCNDSSKEEADVEYERFKELTQFMLGGMSHRMVTISS